MAAIKLGFDTKGNRWTKMVKGKRFQSRSGITKTEAQTEFAVWYAKTFAKQIESNHRDEVVSQAVQKAMSSVGITPATDPAGLRYGLTIQATLNSKTLDESLTAGGLIQKYIDNRKAAVSKARFAVLKPQLDQFKSCIYHTGLEEVTLEQWEKYIALLKTKSPAYGKDSLATCRAMYRFLFDTDLISKIPKFVFAKHFKISIPATDKDTLTAQQVKLTLAKAPDLMELCLLICLNTGCTQEDLSQLTWDMIDLNEGTLTRVRTKHKHRSASANVPRVKYYLWQRVLKRLAALPNRSGRVFSTPRGNALVQKRSDYLSQMYRKWGYPLSVKEYRKFGATTLGGSDFREFRELYLANSSGVTDKNYDRTKICPQKVTDFIEKSIWPHSK